MGSSNITQNDLVYCVKCNILTVSTITGSNVKCNDCQNERNDYPYWKLEFDKEFKGYQVWYSEGGSKPRRKYADLADEYRVFMILCNNNWEKTRMEVLSMLKEATFERPIQIENEWFWTEKE